MISSDATLVTSDILRDGGSAVILLDQNGQRVRVRAMWSMAEQRTADCGKIALTVDDGDTQIFDHLFDIARLDAVIAQYHQQIDPRVLNRFGAAN